MGAACFLPWVPGGSIRVCHDCFGQEKLLNVGVTRVTDVTYIFHHFTNEPTICKSYAEQTNQMRTSYTPGQRVKSYSSLSLPLDQTLPCLPLHLHWHETNHPPNGFKGGLEVGLTLASCLLLSNIFGHMGIQLGESRFAGLCTVTDTVISLSLAP